MISRGSRNGPRLAAWGSRNGEDAAADTRSGSGDAGARIEPDLVVVRLRERRVRQDPRPGSEGDPTAARRRVAGKNTLHHLYEGGSRQHGRARIRDAWPLGDAR